MSDVKNKVTGLQLSNNTYDNAKFFVQIVLPALAVLYASLSQWWGFPKVQEVVGTIGAVALFLGIVLRISSSNYADPSTPDGDFIITDGGEGVKTVTLAFDKDPEEIINQETIVFKIKRGE